MKLGVTGHQTMPNSAVVLLRDWIAGLRIDSGWTVLSSLADGADQLVANEAVRRGAALLAVIPARDYEQTFTSNTARHAFNKLRDRATTTVVLDYNEPTEEAFFAAGKYIVDNCDLLLAVWDGAPARGLGGTADVVGYAKRQGIAVEIVWPKGVSR